MPSGAAGAVGDSSTADLGAGSFEDTCLSAAADGGVILAPALAAELSGTALPPGWTLWPCRPDGRAEVAGGALTVAGARCGPDALFGSGRSLEFAATFSGGPGQHVGFGTDFVSVPWIMFSTRQGGKLYARSNFYRPEDTNLAGDWLGARHRFRIDWNVLDISYSIDGTVVATQMVPIVGFMRPLVCDTGGDGSSVGLEWVRLTPYRSSGSFTSRVLDAGADVVWVGAVWQAAVPAGTSLRVGVRTGPSAEPDGAWSPWAAVDRSGGAVAGTGRYSQYRAELATTAAARTPVLRDVALRYQVT